MVYNLLNMENKEQAYTPEQFQKDLNKFLEDKGYALSFKPVFLPTNHNSFEISVQVSIEKVSKGQ